MARYAMLHIIKCIPSLLLLMALIFSVSAHAAITIVAAENIYGSVASQLGGNNVHVISLLNNPDEDPHLFSATVSSAKAVANADIIIYNGASYDNWMEKLLSVKQQHSRQIICIAKLLNTPTGANPHLWYDPKTIPIYAQQLVQTLQQLDPAHQNYYNTQFRQYMSQYQLLSQKVMQMQQQFHGISVTATEPLFGYMAQAIGLKMEDVDFQWSVMNNVEPSASQLRQMQDHLNNHIVRLLFYNKQVSNPLTQNLLTIAQKNHIPIVGLTELQPANTTYLQWMLDQLNSTEQALKNESGK